MLAVIYEHHKYTSTASKEFVIITGSLSLYVFVILLCMLGFIWCHVSVGHWEQYDTVIYPKKDVLKITSAKECHYPLNDPNRCSLDLINEHRLLSYLQRHKRDIEACEVTDLPDIVNAVKKIFTQLSKQIYCSLTLKEYIVHDPITPPQLKEVPMTVCLYPRLICYVIVSWFMNFHV